MAAKYMAAINVLAGWAILPFFSPTPHSNLPPPLGTWMDLPHLLHPRPPGSFLWVRGYGSGEDEGEGARERRRWNLWLCSRSLRGRRSIGPVAECRGNQPLITPAVVFTLLRASACLHSFAPEFALSPHQLHRSSLQPLPPAPSFCSRRCSTTTLSPPPPSPSPPFLITLTLFLSGKVRWSHSAGAAFHGHLRCRHILSVNTAVVQVFATICP